MKMVRQQFGLMLAAVLVFSFLNVRATTIGASDVAATLVEFSLNVDGKITSLWAYEIDGGMYFKLRDLAMALNGTTKQFEVEWHCETRSVALYPGTPYTPVGGELAAPTDPNPAHAAISATSFQSNSLLSYIIDDCHYIKLSDLAASLRFLAVCDGAARTARIDTTTDTVNIPEAIGESRPIDNIALMDAAYSWSVSADGNVILSFDGGDGEARLETPVILGKDRTEYADGRAYPGVYLSEEKIAIAYGGTNIDPVHVICSDDMGKTWSTPVMVSNTVRVSSLHIGFATPSDGWLVIGSLLGLGHQDNYIYRTVDGGKTWVQIGNPNKLYSRVLTGAGFADGNIGFLSFRFEFADFSPAICRTLDGGQTWEKIHITLQEEFDQYYSKTPLTPVFHGADGIYPIELRLDDYAGTTTVIYLTSHDYGKTWTYNETR